MHEHDLHICHYDAGIGFVFARIYTLTICNTMGWVADNYDKKYFLEIL